MSAALRHGVRHVFIQRDPVTTATPPSPGGTPVKCICTVIIYVSHRVMTSLFTLKIFFFEHVRHTGSDGPEDGGDDVLDQEVVPVRT